MKKVCIIEGEDAAPEAMRPTVEILKSLDLDIELLYPPVGEVAMEEYGSYFPPTAIQMIDEADTTLFGSARKTTVAALVYLRFGKKTFANVRPTRWLQGFPSPLKEPEHLDFIIVRECLEGSYMRVEGDIEELAPLNMTSPFYPDVPLHKLGKGKFGIKINTEENCEQVARYAFELARQRKAKGYPGKVTITSKYNMYLQSDGLFQDHAKKVGLEYPEIEIEEKIIDSMAHDLVRHYHDLDVVLMPNLYGDILSDAAAGLSGGLGVAPSGCYGNDFAYFEPVHGTAPDIVGENCINPTAAMLSAVMMLEYLGFQKAAKRWEDAIKKVYQEGKYVTKDVGGKSSTTEFSKAVLSYL